MTDPRSPPRVIVGLPVRNGAPHLREALNSVLTQEFASFRLVVADNGSTDATPSIVEEIAAHDARVVYVRFDDVVDVTQSFNRLLAWATGEYFIWIAHDDLWEPSLLRRLVQVLDRDPGAVLAYASLDSIDDLGRQTRTYPTVADFASREPRWRRLARIVAARESGGKANLVYGLLRAQVARRSGGFRVYTRQGWGQDYHLVFKFAAAGRFTHVTETLFHKRVSSTNPAPPLRERLAYAYAFAGISREIRLPALSRGAVAGAIVANVIRVLAERSTLYFSPRDALHSFWRRLDLRNGP
jgi:glycosyltransferase involved in cell wall biosynthesis